MNELTSLLRKSPKFSEVSPNDIEIIDVKKNENDLYFVRIFGEDLVLKLSKKGYGEYEYRAMRLLSDEGYPVPEPTDFVPFHEIEKEDWTYGDVKRKIGLLIYQFIKGENLEKRMDKERVLSAVKLLKRLHEDDRHKREKPFIPNYQRVEVGRAKYYLAYLSGLGYLSQQDVHEILKFAESYEKKKIDFRVIHGDFRPNNLIVSDRINMIDFEGFSEGADRYKDVGTFIAEVDRIGDRKNIEFDQERILRTYSQRIGFDEKQRIDYSRVRRGLVFMKYDPDYRKRARERIMEIVHFYV